MMSELYCPNCGKRKLAIHKEHVFFSCLSCNLDWEIKCLNIKRFESYSIAKLLDKS